MASLAPTPAGAQPAPRAPSAPPEVIFPEEPEEPWVMNEAGVRCGVERWSVKTGSDHDAGRVNLTPVDTTLADLVRAAALPSPPLDARVPPYELTTYRLRDVTLVRFKLEADSDYHLVLSDGTHEMIAEIPEPACMDSSSPFFHSAQQARRAFDARHRVTARFQTVNEPVTLVGVGFFDFPHGQSGVAPNAFELHSVLGICFGLGCSPEDTGVAQGGPGERPSPGPGSPPPRRGHGRTPGHPRGHEPEPAAPPEPEPEIH